MYNIEHIRPAVHWTPMLCGRDSVNILLDLGTLWDHLSIKLAELCRGACSESIRGSICEWLQYTGGIHAEAYLK